jgi:hypothetical protein
LKNSFASFWCLFWLWFASQPTCNRPQTPKLNQVAPHSPLVVVVVYRGSPATTTNEKKTAARASQLKRA